LTVKSWKIPQNPKVMKNIIWIILFVFFGCRCIGQISNPQFIDNLAGKYKNLNLTMVIPVFGKVCSQAVTTNTRLNQIYTYKGYRKKYGSFNTFLSKVLNKNILLHLDSADLRKENLIDTSSQLFSEYNKKGFGYFKKKYLDKTEDGKFHEKKTNLVYRDRNALIEIMFSHHFYIVFSDYTGFFSFYENAP